MDDMMLQTSAHCLISIEFYVFVYETLGPRSSDLSIEFRANFSDRYIFLRMIRFIYS